MDYKMVSSIKELINIPTMENSMVSNLYHLPHLFSSLCFTLNLLSEWLAAAVLAVLVVWRRDSEGLWAAMGSLVNVVFSIALKNVFNQPRPFPPKRSDPGMPSSHAQIIFYTSTFSILSMVEVAKTTNQLTLVLGGVAVLLASYLSWLRVLEKYHTMAQVLVGASLGATFAILWQWAWASVVFEAFQSIMWVRILVIMGATAFWVVFSSVTHSKLSKHKGLTSKWV